MNRYAKPAILAAVLLCCTGVVFAGFSLGRPAAFQKRIDKLDAKVRDFNDNMVPRSSIPQVGNGAVEIRWDPVPGAVGYNLYLWGNGNSQGSRASDQRTVYQNVTSPYLLTGLSNGVSYYFSLTSVNSSGVESTPSTPRSVVGIAALPEIPVSLSFVAGTNQISLSWGAVSGATSYRLYWLESSGVDINMGHAIDVSTNTYLHTGLRETQRYYYYRVSAVNSLGESLLGNELSAYTNRPPTVEIHPFRKILLPGESISVVVGLTDPDDDDFSHNCSVSGGILSEGTPRSGSYVWQAPAESGLYTMSCVNTDSYGLSATAEVVFEVSTANHPPKFVSFTPKRTIFTLSEQVRYCSAASDPDLGEQLDYVWSVSDGTIYDHTYDSCADWTAPSTSGTATISCTVTDPHGASDTRSVVITVQ